jgi:hypothetical protein
MKTAKAKTDELGPFVIVATFCEEVRRDADGVPSLLGLLEGIVVETPSAPIMVRLVLFIILHAGSRHGRQTLTVTADAPGFRLEIAKRELVWTTDQRHHEERISMETALPEAGEYLFDVRVDGRLLTRVPFRLFTRRDTDQTSQPPAVY